MFFVLNDQLLVAGIAIQTHVVHPHGLVTNFALNNVFGGLQPLKFDTLSPTRQGHPLFWRGKENVVLQLCPNMSDFVEN